jgi:hypothetical protein
MPAPVLQFKRGNAGVAGTVPALRPGEPAISLNNFDFFIGIDTSVVNNKFFGSHRYWEREESGTKSLKLKLVSDNGSQSINLQAPVSLASTFTYTLPATAIGYSGRILSTNESGQLSWVDQIDILGVENIVIGIGTFTSNVAFTTTTASTSPTTGGVVITGGLGVGGDVNIGDDLGVTGIGTFGGAVTIYDGTQSTNKDTGALVLEGGIGVEKNANIGGDFRVVGIATFADATDNTLGDENTGSVQIDGGVGIAKNLTVKQNLHVGGYSEFVGVVTFRGGTINLGDEDTDDINVGGEFISGLYPNTTNTYDLGDGTRQWRHGNFAGIVTATTGAVLDAIQIGITAAGEIDTSTGGLTLDSASGQTTIDDNLSVTGIATVTGAFVANGDVTLGDTSGDTITINGTTTFTQPLVGTISTATRATLVDTTTAPSGTFYPGLFVNNTGTESTAVYVDSGISYVSNTDTLVLTGDIAVNGGDVTTSATTFNLINGTATNVNFAGAATALVMSAATGITTISNNLTVGGDLRVNGNDIQASDGNNNITLTSNTLTTFAGDIRVNGNDIQASDGNINISMTSNTLTEVKGDLKVTGNDIQSSAGVVAITLADNDVTVADDLTVQGNLYVNGSTTQVNTNSLTVEDRTIDLGIVNGAAPASTTTWDLGILFNYNSSGAKKSAVIWEHADTRFKFASVLGVDAEGTDVNTPQLTVTTFAPIEIGALWVNDCAGQSQVISCTGTERFLENITVDAGTF